MEQEIYSNYKKIIEDASATNSSLQSLVDAEKKLRFLISKIPKSDKKHGSIRKLMEFELVSLQKTISDLSSQTVNFYNNYLDLGRKIFNKK